MSTKRNLPIMGYERPYYADFDYHPFIFYIIFGVNAEELVVSKERHRVDEFPKGLDLSFFKKPVHCDYMNAMLGGTLGKVLNDNYPRACLKNAFRQMYVTICGRFAPGEEGVVGYTD